MGISSKSNITTTLLACDSDWDTKAQDIMGGQGWSTHFSSRQVTTWQEENIIAVSDELFFVSGISIRKIWLGGKIGNNAIRITPLRLYFDSINPKKPLRQAEYVLLNGKPRPRVDRNTLYILLGNTKNTLCHEGSFTPINQQPGFHNNNLLSQVQAIGRGNSRIPLSNDIWAALAKSGAFSYPKELALYVVNDNKQQKGPHILNEYIDLLQDKWRLLTRDPEAIQIKRIDLDKLIQRLRTQSGQGALTNAVFLIALSGHVGDPLPKRQQEALELLDKNGIPYRLFSYDNKNPRFSASSQMLSILSAAGGKPYRLLLNYPDDFSHGALIGVDIGHDIDWRRSTVVASLLEPDGNHILSLKKHIPLNEAIPSQIVTRMLRSLKKQSEKLLSRSIERAIIFRDGRIPTKCEKSGNESLHDYLEALEIPTSLVEIRKRGNPPLCQQTDNGLRAAKPGSMFSPEGSDVRLITCYETIQQAGPPKTFKVTIPRSADRFNWGIDAYTGIVCGLCYSPSLGTKPHLPGPIYWADGIAKTSDTDNRFRGQNVKTIA